MDVIQGYECLNSCITNCFNYYGIPISSSDIFFIGKGLQITYENINEPNIGAYLYESNFEFLKKYNISYIHSNSNKALNLIINSINIGKPIIIKVSSTYLTYNRVFKQTDNSTHYIIVENMDNDNFLIIDGFVPTVVPSRFRGYVKKEEILQAWEAKNYEYILINEYKEIPNIKNDSLKMFKKLIKIYLKESDEMGLYTLRKLVIDLKIYVEANNFRQMMLDINYKIKIYGYLTSKYYILEKIKENDEWSNLYDEYKDLVEKYNMLTFSLVKFGITRSNDVYLRILNNTFDLLEKEKNILKKICGE